MIRVDIQRRDGLPVPLKATPGAAAYDLVYPYQRIYIEPRETVMVPTGLRLQIPHGYEGQIRSRSGLARAGIVVANSPGTIDSDYRGEVKVLLRNDGRVTYRIDGGSRIAQLVIAPVLDVAWVEWVEDTTDRGANGFGSTGT